MSWGDENTVFDVVINDEEQYSIWPTYKAIPAGRRAVGKQGKKQECLSYIDEVWVDMRPLSLRKAMEESARTGKPIWTAPEAVPEVEKIAVQAEPLKVEQGV